MLKIVSQCIRWGFLPFVLLLVFAANGATQDLIWSSYYGGSYNEDGAAGCRLSDSGYAVLGTTYSFGNGDHDIYLLRLNKFGDTLWTRNYGGSDADYGRDIQPVDSNGFIIVGFTLSFGNGLGDVYLVRVDSSGNVLWSRTYGGTQRDEGASVLLSPEGGFVIAGTTNSYGNGYADMYLLKTDASGNLQWNRTYGGAGGESGSTVRRTLDGGYVVIGSTGSFGEGYSSIYLVRTDVNGDSLWTSIYGGTKADFGYSAEVTPDGGFILAGATSSFGSGMADAYLLKTDQNGVLQWEQWYGGAMDDRVYAVQRTGDGGYMLGGTTKSFGSGSFDCYAIRTDPAGQLIWSNTYGGVGADYCRSIIVEPNSFCLFGCTFSYSSGGSDVFVVKAHGDEMTPVEDSNRELMPTDFVLAQNYPNPFNMSTTIEFSLSHRSAVRLVIYNILGQEVAQWSYTSVPVGLNSIVWTGCDQIGNEVASGIYLYRLDVDGLSLTRKMALLK